MLTAYEYQCAFCGYDGTLSGSAVGLDAAHVRWFAFDGPDQVDNGVSLCTLHHKLFDKGVLGLAEGSRVAVSVHFIVRSPAARAHVLDLAGMPVRPPQRGFAHPDPAHTAWHRDQVFRTPPRVTASCSAPEARGRTVGSRVHDGALCANHRMVAVSSAPPRSADRRGGQLLIRDGRGRPATDLLLRHARSAARPGMRESRVYEHEERLLWRPSSPPRRRRLRSCS